jgi:hypothetical protein
MNSNAGDLAPRSPDTREARSRAGLDAQGGQPFDQRRLQLPQVPVQVLSMFPEVDDWVPHQLTRTMKGDVPTALDIEDLQTSGFQVGARQRQAARPDAASERNDRLMLDQEQDVFRDLTRNTLPAKTALKFKHLRVICAAKVLHHQAGTHRLRASRLVRTASSAALTALRPIVTSKPAWPNI